MIPDFFVVRSQINNLTPGPSFSHDLCFKYPNGSCEPILMFQKLFNDIKNFSIQWVQPLQSLFEDSIVHRDPKSQSGNSLGSVGVHSLTFFHILESMKYDFWASFLTRTFTSSCLGHEPRVKIVTQHEKSDNPRRAT